MHILLLDCNKVSAESFCNIAAHCKLCDCVCSSFSLGMLGRSSDVLSYEVIDAILQKYLPLDAILVADIFWPTGQNICKWCINNKVKCFFWQHGQWIYTKNKVNPPYLPFCTFLFGDDVFSECKNWSYGKKSNLLVTGSPRYDNCRLNPKGSYIYFSPPVILEKSPSVKDKYNPKSVETLKNLGGIDKELDIVIHPHYREGYIGQLRELFPRAIIADTGDSALDLIQESSKVLTHRNSTTVLDAIACGKQSVLMSQTSSYPVGYFGKFADEVSSMTEYVKCLSTPSVDIEDYYHKARKYILLGNASQRIIDYIIQYKV